MATAGFFAGLASSLIRIEAMQLLDELVGELLKMLYVLNDGTQEALARMLTILHELSAYYPKVLLLDACWFAHHVQRLLMQRPEHSLADQDAEEVAHLGSGH